MSELVTLHPLNGKKILATTTKQIAEYTNKRHDNIIRDVEELLNTSQFDLLNFEESSYVNAQNKKQKMYVMDRTLTDVLLMGFTGKEAVKWKIAYSKSFQDMEKQVQAAKDPTVEFFKNFILEIPEKHQKCFPAEYYNHVHRILKVKKPGINNHSSCAGFTNKFIYGPLFKSQGIVLDLLRIKNPLLTKEDGSKYRKERHHQYLDKIAIVNLQAHIHEVLGLLKASVNKRDFEALFGRMFHCTDVLLECFPIRQPERREMSETYLF